MTKAIANRTTGGLNEAFPFKICINLDRRPNRWQQMHRKFDQHGIHSVRRFAALDGDNMNLPANWIHTPGAYGCLLSHLQVVREARRLGVSSVLIFEDDVVFDDHLEKKFSIYIDQLPPDWDMLFFGALHKDEPIKVADNIARITQANSTYAYVLRETVFDDFIELNRKSEEELDNNSLVLQQRFKCYCFMPHLAWVETDYSDAQQRLVHHWYLQESLVLFGPQVDRLLSETTIVFAHGDHTGVGRATENLMYLVHYFDKFFSPYIAMIVVEQGAQPTINPATLPTNCKYVFLRDESLFDRERCFITGISGSNPSRNFVILSDNDIYLETLDIRANLRMCERYDWVTGFSKIIDLTNEDSLRLRNTKTTRGIDITKTTSLSNEHQGYCRFFSREAIQILRGWDEGDLEKAGPLLSLQATQLRVFQSPNHALRLQPDRTCKTR
ncbi:MAG: glycosyltransferase family 25 protein [Pyrinomonadaceae bacterium]